jgi:hypothetical protein
MTLEQRICVLKSTQRQAASFLQRSLQTVVFHPSVRRLFRRHPFVAIDHGARYCALQILLLRATSLL